MRTISLPAAIASAACALLLLGGCQRSGRPPASAAPKPAPTGPSLSAVYASGLQVDAQHLVAANGARTTSCATGRDLASCRSALQQVVSAATALQHDLDAHPAPTCMQA